MRALVIVDVQNDFCEGGSLAVQGGAATAAAISRYLASGGGGYGHVVASRDYHIDPGSHFSGHPDYAASWPPHCVAGTPGALFHPGFDTARVGAVFTKGTYTAAYSAFEGADEAGTPLAQWLRERGIGELDIAGIATDHCVRASALDAVRGNFATRVLAGLTVGVDPATTAAALAEMAAAGAEISGGPPGTGTAGPMTRA